MFTAHEGLIRYPRMRHPTSYRRPQPPYLQSPHRCAEDMVYSNSHMQDVLLNELDATYEKILNIQRDLGDDDEVCEATYRLQDEFNALSHDINRRVYPDPLDVLPPEVWQEIILEAVGKYYITKERMNDTLALTSVSVAWLRKITENPLFWNKVYLNPSEPDNAAKVATCLELSRDCPISLLIDACSYEEWIKMSPSVLPHIQRTVKLVIRGPRESDILNSMPILLNVRDFDCSALGDLPLGSPDFKALERIDRSRLPQLRQVHKAIVWAPLSFFWLQPAEEVELSCKTFSDEHVDSFTRMHRLRHLSIYEAEPSGKTETHNIQTPLLNLESLLYVGPNAKQIIGLIGRSLVSLELGCYTLDVLWDVIAIAQYTPISDLALRYAGLGSTRSSSSSAMQSISHQRGVTAPGIKFLQITYPELTMKPTYDEWVQSIHSIVVHTLVGVERIHLYRALLTRQVQHYCRWTPNRTDSDG